MTKCIANLTQYNFNTVAKITPSVRSCSYEKIDTIRRRRRALSISSARHVLGVALRLLVDHQRRRPPTLWCT